MKEIFLELKENINYEEIVEFNDKELILYFNRLIIDYCRKKNIEINTEEVLEISKKLKNSFRGFGILEDFLDDESINEIMINSYDTIFIEKSGKIIKSSNFFENNDSYNRIIQKIVGEAGREVNLSNPIVDAMLYDGSRVNIVLPPISKDNPVVTIRKFSKNTIGMEELIKKSTIDEEVAEFLKYLIKSKYNILIGGATSSGKTTLLNALSELIGEEERIVTIEDSRELSLIGKPNLVSLETRNSNNSNKGEIDIKALIKNSLRMRPDRIIVGEVRADEALDMLQAMNTGHEGSLSTVHANSCEDMISRVETMVLRSPIKIPMEAIKKMILASIEILIYVKRISGNERKVMEISELYLENNQIKINKLYEYNYFTKKIEKTKNKFINDEKFKRVIYEK